MYKPPVVNNSNVSGLANVRKSKDGQKFQVVLKVKTSDGEVKTEQYVLNAKDCPAYLKSGDWRVRMKQDGSKLYSAIPADAIVKVRFHDIAHKQDEEPTPSVQRTKFGDVIQFTLIVKVIDGEFKDVEIPIFLNYHFTPVDDGSKQVVGYSHPKSKYTALLMETLDALGVWSDEFGPMQWSDNILPKLKKRAMKAGSDGVAAQIILSDGWVAKVKALGVASSDDESEEEQPSEKPEEEQLWD